MYALYSLDHSSRSYITSTLPTIFTDMALFLPEIQGLFWQQAENEKNNIVDHRVEADVIELLMELQQVVDTVPKRYFQTFSGTAEHMMHHMPSVQLQWLYWKLGCNSIDGVTVFPGTAPEHQLKLSA